jgi:hypothetical protein
MTEYLVKWAMNIEADTPEQAAEEALKIHRDVESEASIFNVIDLDTNISKLVDAVEDDDNRCNCTKIKEAYMKIWKAIENNEVAEGFFGFRDEFRMLIQNTEDIIDKDTKYQLVEEKICQNISD